MANSARNRTIAINLTLNMGGVDNMGSMRDPKAAKIVRKRKLSGKKYGTRREMMMPPIFRPSVVQVPG